MNCALEVYDTQREVEGKSAGTGETFYDPPVSGIWHAMQWNTKPQRTQSLTQMCVQSGTRMAQQARVE